MIIVYSFDVTGVDTGRNKINCFLSLLILYISASLWDDIVFFLKKSKHVTIFTSKYSDKLQQLRDKLQYLHYWNDQGEKREKKKADIKFFISH